MASPITVQTHNPGALTDGPWARSQPGYVGANGDFAVFDSPDSGRAAQLRLLGNYAASGHNTISSIINKWAPQAANSPGSTGNYIGYVAQRTGLDPNAPLSPDQLGAVATAQQEWESGLKKGGFTPPASVSAAPDTSKELDDIFDTPSAPAAAPDAGTTQSLDSIFGPDAAPSGAQVATGPGTFAGKPVTPGAMGNNPMARGKPTSPSAPTGYTPSSLPGIGTALAPVIDPIGTAANSLVDSLPFGIGPTLTRAGNAVDAGLNNLLGYPTEEPDDRAAVNAAMAKQFPAASTTGSVVGTVAPYMLAGPESAAAKVLGTASDYGAAGPVGNLLFRAGAGGLSAATSAAADTAVRGGTLPEVGQNALMAGAGGALAAPVASALGSVRGTLARGALGAGAGAALGGAATLAAGGTPDSAMGNALTGAGIGAGVGIGLGAAGKISAALMRGGIDPATADLADAAINKYHIPLGAADISANPMVKVTKSVVDKMPFSGGVSSIDQQRSAFTRALANEMGTDATALTPDVMQATKDRIGDVFDSVAERVPAVHADPQFQNDVLQAMQDAEGSLGADKMVPFNKQVDNIMSTFGNGNAITGQQFLSLTDKKSILSKAIASGGDLGNAASALKDALFGAMERAAPPSVLNDLQKARYQWKVMRTIEDPVAKSTDGDFSPARLMGAVAKNFPNMAYDGAGNMGELAKIGQRFLTAPGSSQTTERGMAKDFIGSIGGIIAAPHVGIPAVVGTLAASRAAGAAMRSRWLANALMAPPPVNAQLNMLTRGAVPALAGPQINRLLAGGQ